MLFDNQMVTFEEIIKNDFFKWAQYFIQALVSLFSVGFTTVCLVQAAWLACVSRTY